MRLVLFLLLFLAPPAHAQPIDGSELLRELRANDPAVNVGYGALAGTLIASPLLMEADFGVGVGLGGLLGPYAG